MVLSACTATNSWLDSWTCQPVVSGCRGRIETSVDAGLKVKVCNAREMQAHCTWRRFFCLPEFARRNCCPRSRKPKGNNMQSRKKECQLRYELFCFREIAATIVMPKFLHRVAKGLICSCWRLSVTSWVRSSVQQEKPGYVLLFLWSSVWSVWAVSKTAQYCTVDRYMVIGKRHVLWAHRSYEIPRRAGLASAAVVCMEACCESDQGTLLHCTERTCK